MKNLLAFQMTSFSNINLPPYWYSNHWSASYYRFEHSQKSMMRNIPILPRQYSKHKTRGEEKEKCLDEGLESAYYFSVFRGNEILEKWFHWL